MAGITLPLHPYPPSSQLSLCNNDTTFSTPRAGIFTTVRGVPYTPLWKAVPSLEPLYTDYEKSYNAAPAVFFLRDQSWIPVVAVLLYLTFCFQGPRIMRNRKAFDLKGALALWNLGLSIISFVGAVRVGMHLLYLLLAPESGFGFRGTLCRSPEESYGDNATGLWCIIFTVSKVFELIDTVFVVLRKKPLIFLHWYHHTTVLLVSWFGHVTLTPGLYFMSINYSIHAIMYFYFYLAAVNCVPKWFNPLWITTAQISQMFVGVYVMAMTVWYKYGTEASCAVDERMVVAILLMYSSYLWLFVDFFLKRFVFKNNGKSSSSSKGGKGAGSVMRAAVPAASPDDAKVMKRAQRGNQ